PASSQIPGCYSVAGQESVITGALISPVPLKDRIILKDSVTSENPSNIRYHPAIGKCIHRIGRRFS
ncbi:MAG: hypothetical protein LUO98_03040, partial [Methanoregula sp.]|nr:hypothetical protein [Methanoregula sp.]